MPGIQTLSTPLSALAALAAVLALVLLAARLARRAGLAIPRVGGAARRLSLHDTLPLDRARRLHVVRCDGRDVLILTGGQTDLLVGWLPAPGTPHETPPGTPPGTPLGAPA